MSDRPTLSQLDPGIEAIFDALIAYMGDDFPSLNAYANYDGVGTNLGVSATDDTGNRFSYTEYRQGVRITLNPASASLAAGGSQQFTASAFNPDGSPVAAPVFAWSVMAGGLGTVDQTGLYAAPAAVPAATIDTVRCEITGSNSWALATVSLLTA